MRQKLTKTAIDKAKPDPRRDVIIWDTETLGFGLRVTKGGVKSFVSQYHLKGRDRRVTLGRYGAELTLKQARGLALDVRFAVREGRDPAQERREEAKAPKVADLEERFMAQHASKRSAKTRANYRSTWKHLLKRWAKRRVDSIVWDDVSTLHHEMREIPSAANKALKLISKAWDLARKWGWYPPELRNPGRDHDPFPENGCGLSLRAEQLAALGAALEADSSTLAAAAVRATLLTGLRPKEIRMARWKDVDLEKRLLDLPESKTGPRVGFLGQPAVDLISRQPRLSDYVFPGRKLNKPFYDFKGVWQRAKARAGLEQDVRLYDATRHTFTTWGLENGVPLERVQILVGHSVDVITIKTYTHLKRDFILKDADKVSMALEKALSGK